MDERRTAPRVACVLPVRFMVAGSPHPIETLSKNLGLGGLMCLSPRRLPLLSPISLEMPLGRSREPLIVQGLVRWIQEIQDSQQYFVGITFLGLDREDTVRLSRYLETTSILASQSAL